MNDHVPRSKLWTRPRRARRPWRKVVLTILALFLGSLVLFLPNLLGILLPNQLLALAGRSLDGELSASTLKLGWFQPIVLKDVLAVDSEGEAVFEATELRSEKTLLQLITSSGELGRFIIRSPQLHVVTWAHGSNVERLLDPMLTSTDDGTGRDSPLQVSWELEDGRIDFQSPRQRNPVVWTLPRLTGEVARGESLLLQLDSVIQFSSGNERGEVVVRLNGGTFGRGETAGTEAAFQFDAESVPLSALQPLVARFEPDGELRGEFQGRARVRLDLTHGTGRMEELLATVSQLELRAPLWLGDEDLRADRLELQGDMAWDPEQWQATAARFTSDFGTVRFRGTTRPVTALQAGSAASLTSHLMAHSLVSMQADLDLARVVETLPQLTRRRDDVTIDAIRVTLDVNSTAMDRGGTKWRAEVMTTDLEASRNGTPLVWETPLEATLTGRWLVDHLEVEELTCRSDFVNARFEGTTERGSVKAEADLNRMLTRLTEFFDVEGLDAGGEISGQLSWTQRRQQIELDGRLWLDDFVWSPPERPLWRETQLALQLAMKLQQDSDGSIAGIPSASFDLTAPAERLSAKLRRPVAAPWDRAEWAFDLEASGRVERWRPRLQVLVDMTEVELGGLAELRGKLTIRPTLLDVESLSVNLEQFLLARQNVRVDEPLVVVEAAGVLSRLTGSWSTEEIRIQTSTVSASSGNLQILMEDPDDNDERGESFRGRDRRERLTARGDEARSTKIRGDLNFFSDLGRIQRWFPTPQIRTSRVEGEVRGLARFAASEQGSRLDLQMDVSSFQLFGWRETPANRSNQATGDWKSLWIEPKIAIRGQGELDMDGEKLSLAELRVSGEGFSVRGEGQLDDLTGRMLADFQGELQYNLQPLSDKLRRLTVEDLALTGRQRQPFSLQGPLRRPAGQVADPAAAAATLRDTAIIPRELQGTASFGWESADVLAIQVGQGQLASRLENARLQFSMLNIPVSGGVLTAQPYLDFQRPPARLELPPGPLLTDLQITPSMCRTWLLYVAPLVAQATSAEGRFSLQLDHLSMPLGTAEAADISGALAIQQGRIGPGPLAQQLISVAEGIPVLLGRRPAGSASPTRRGVEIPAQVVAFDMQDGRVSHQQMEMRVGEVRLTTTGWVGIDQSMSLTVQVWVRDDWIQGRPLLEGLRGQAISIPVTGTLNRPQIDDRILRDLSRQAVGSAAGGLLRDLFDRQRPRGPDR